MTENSQTEASQRSSTLAFRVSDDVKHLVKAAASRRDVLPSDYLRHVLWSALEEEFGASDGTPAQEAVEDAVG